MIVSSSSTPWLVFQSALPHGGRHDGRWERVTAHVSIRAPARGATVHGFNPRPRTGGDLVSVFREFQSAPPHGGRPVMGAPSVRQLTFQSAPPHGGRHRKNGRHQRDACFNPRPRTGGDVPMGQPVPHVQSVSIRAPARGATRCEGRYHIRDHVSIRAPARGATRRWDCISRVGSSFQSAPPHGGRPPEWTGLTRVHMTFQSAPPHGGRHVELLHTLIKELFQSAPPHGGRPCAL